MKTYLVISAIRISLHFDEKYDLLDKYSTVTSSGPSTDSMGLNFLSSCYKVGGACQQATPTLTHLD